MNTPPPRTSTGHTSTPLDPRVRAVLTAPRGHRFSRPRRYVRLRPASAPDRPAVLRATTQTPPWPARLHTGLTPDHHGTGTAPHVRPSPAVPGRTGGSRTRTRRPCAPRRWTCPRSVGCETAPYSCTVLVLLFAAYLIGLLG